MLSLFSRLDRNYRWSIEIVRGDVFFYFVLKLPSYRLIPQNKNTSSRLTLHSQFLDSRLTLCNATSSSYLHRCKYVHICMQLRWCPVESFNVLTHFLRLVFLRGRRFQSYFSASYHFLISLWTYTFQFNFLNLLLLSNQ